MTLQNPPHPGGIVMRQCLEPLGLTIAEAAKELGVSQQTLSDLINKRTSMSTDLAIRLSKSFVSNAETWVGMQTAYDLWQLRIREDEIKVVRYASEREIAATSKTT